MMRSSFNCSSMPSDHKWRSGLTFASMSKYPVSENSIRFALKNALAIVFFTSEDSSAGNSSHAPQPRLASSTTISAGKSRQIAVYKSRENSVPVRQLGRQ